MKNEQRYGGIKQAQMKDLGVLFSRSGAGLGRLGVGGKKKNVKKKEAKTGL